MQIMKVFPHGGLFIGTCTLALQTIAAGPCPSGKVLDEARHPILKAAIFMNGQPAGTSGADGGFQVKCEGLTPPATIRIETPDEIPYEAQWTGAPLPGEIVLMADDALRGAVVMREGPVAGTKVELFTAAHPFETIMRREKNGAGSPLASADASVSGRFRLPGRPAGLYRLLISAPGFVSLISAPLKFRKGKWKPQDFTLDPESRLTGMVTATGNPVADAPVLALVAVEALMKNFQSKDEPLQFFTGRNLTAKTDAQGRYAINGLPAGIKLMMLIDAPEFAPATSAEFKSGEAVSPIALAAGGTLTGHLRAKDGSAIKNPRVVASSGYDPQRWVSLAEEPGARKAEMLPPDDDGIPFRINRVAAGKPALTVHATGFITVKNVVVDLLEAGKAGHDFILEPGWGLSGAVVDADGKPVADATVIARKPDKDAMWFAGKMEQAHDGRFEFTGLAEPVVNLRVISSGYVQTRVMGVDVRKGVPVRIVLGRTARVTGRVVTEAGAPINEFNLDADGEGFMQSVAVISDDGYFEVQIPLETANSIRIASEGYTTASIGDLAIKAGGRRDLGVITLKPGLSASGKIVNEQGGAIADAQIVISKSGEWREHVKVKSDHSGAFQAAGLAPGQYRVTVSHELYTDGRAEFTLDPQRNMEPLLIKLKRGLSLTVEVLDEQGQSSSDEIVMSFARGTEPLKETAPGRYFVDGMTAGKIFLLFAKPPMFSRSVTLVKNGDNRFTIRRGKVRVEGTIKRGGQPVANERVIFGYALFDDEQSAFMAASMDDVPGLGLDAVTTDAAGKYHTEVPAGDYSVRAVGMHKAVSLGNEPAAVVDIEIGDQGIKGCVVGKADRKPLSGVWIAVMISNDFETRRRQQTDASGCYHFDGIKAGKYSLQAGIGGVHASGTELDVSDHMVEAETIEMNIGAGRIAGRLMNLDGSVFSGHCSIFFHTTDVESSASVSGSDGRYEILTLPEGAYTITADCRGKADTTATASLTLQTGMSVNLDFQLRPEAVIRVKLRDAQEGKITEYIAKALSVASDCPCRESYASLHKNAEYAELNNLAACEYTVTATDTATKKSATTKVRVSEGEIRDLELKLAP